MTLKAISAFPRGVHGFIAGPMTDVLSRIVASVHSTAVGHFFGKVATGCTLAAVVLAVAYAGRSIYHTVTPSSIKIAALSWKIQPTVGLHAHKILNIAALAFSGMVTTAAAGMLLPGGLGYMAYGIGCATTYCLS